MCTQQCLQRPLRHCMRRQSCFTPVHHASNALAAARLTAIAPRFRRGPTAFSCRRYRALARIWHPDKNPDKLEEAQGEAACTPPSPSDAAKETALAAARRRIGRIRCGWVNVWARACVRICVACVACVAVGVCGWIVEPVSHGPLCKVQGLAAQPFYPRNFAARFVAIAAAYELLSDADKRRNYDSLKVRTQRGPVPAAVAC